MAMNIGKNVREVFEECVESKFSFTAYDVFSEAKKRGRTEEYDIVENWMLNQDVGEGHFKRIDITDGVRYVLYVSTTKKNRAYDDSEIVKFLSGSLHSGIKTKSGKLFSDSTDKNLKINSNGIKLGVVGQDKRMIVNKNLTTMAGFAVGDTVYAHVENGMIVINKDSNDVFDASYQVRADGRFQVRRGKFIQYLGINPTVVRAFVSKGNIYLKPEK